MRFRLCSLAVCLTLLFPTFAQRTAASDLALNHPLHIDNSKIPAGLKERTKWGYPKVSQGLGGLNFQQSWDADGKGSYYVGTETWIYKNESDAVKNFEEIYEKRIKKLYRDNKKLEEKKAKDKTYENHYRAPQKISAGDEAWHIPFSYVVYQIRDMSKEGYKNKGKIKMAPCFTGEGYLLRKGNIVIYVSSNPSSGIGYGTRYEKIVPYINENIPSKVKNITSLALQQALKFQGIRSGGKEEIKEEKEEYIPEEMKLVKILPRKNEMNIPFKEFIGAAIFEGKWDWKKVSKASVIVGLAYPGSDGKLKFMENVETKFRREGDKLVFLFGVKSGMLDGVKYMAGLRWKDKSGTRDHRWTFSTAPDLEVRVEAVQVLKDMPLVAGKDTAFRVWVRWKNPDPPVESGWIIKECNVRINIEVAKDGQKKLIAKWDSMTPSKYPNVKYPMSGGKILLPQRKYKDPSILKMWMDSINFYGFKPGGTGNRTITAIVAPVPQSYFNPTRYYAFEKVRVVSTTRPIRIQFVTVAVGKWEKNPQRDFSNFIKEQISFINTIFPITGTVLVDTDPKCLKIFRPKFMGKTWKSRALAQLNSYVKKHNSENRSNPIDWIIGIVPTGFMEDLGLTSKPKGLIVYRNAALITENAVNCVSAHEIAHTLNMSYKVPSIMAEHSNGAYSPESIKGFNIPLGKSQKEQTQAIVGYGLRVRDFMEEKRPYPAWICPANYKYLLELFCGREKP